MPSNAAAAYFLHYAATDPKKMEQHGVQLLAAAQGADQPAAPPATPAGEPAFAAATPPPRRSMNDRQGPPPAAGKGGAFTPSSSAWMAPRQAARTPWQPSSQLWAPGVSGADRAMTALSLMTFR